MSIQLFDETQTEEWDEFVVSSSVNGNFLQSRRFLSYHPEGRFEDSSLMYRDDRGNLRAVVPAATIRDVGGKRFVSHPGSTYGGIVFDRKSSSAKRLQVILSDLLSYLEAEGYDSVDLRFPPDFMWRRDDSALAEYMLHLNGFQERIELTTYIDFSSYKEPTTSNFAQGKRTNVNNGIKQGLRCRILNTKDEAEQFYDLLLQNLAKYQAKPVHSFEELWRLHSSVLKEDTVLLGIYDGEALLAAGWLFLFNNMRIAHTQYLCANNAYASLSPMTFLYYSSIEYCKSIGCRYLSWGISTEDSGAVLNWGLTESKEHFGSLHSVHRSYRRRIR